MAVEPGVHLARGVAAGLSGAPVDDPAVARTSVAELDPRRRLDRAAARIAVGARRGGAGDQRLTSSPPGGHRRPDETPAPGLASPAIQPRRAAGRAAARAAARAASNPATSAACGATSNALIRGGPSRAKSAAVARVCWCPDRCGVLWCSDG